MLSTTRTLTSRTLMLILTLLALVTFTACATTPPPPPPPEPEPEPVAVEEPVPMEEPAPVEVAAQMEMPEVPVPEMVTIQIYYQARGLHPEAKMAIDEYIDSLEYPDELLYIVEGYTCNHGVPAYNRKLSLWRAEAVKAYMVERGINADLITTVGHGSDNPVADNSTQMGRVQNRRVTISAELR